MNRPETIGLFFFLSSLSLCLCVCVCKCVATNLDCLDYCRVVQRGKRKRMKSSWLLCFYKSTHSSTSSERNVFDLLSVGDISIISIYEARLLFPAQ